MVGSEHQESGGKSLYPELYSSDTPTVDFPVNIRQDMWPACSSAGSDWAAYPIGLLSYICFDFTYYTY